MGRSALALGEGEGDSWGICWAVRRPPRARSPSVRVSGCPSRAVRPLAARPRFDGPHPLGRPRVVLVHEVVERAQHAIQAVHVGFDLAGQQPQSRHEGALVAHCIENAALGCEPLIRSTAASEAASEMPSAIMSVRTPSCHAGA